jgi:hypothetical protein
VKSDVLWPCTSTPTAEAIHFDEKWPTRLCKLGKLEVVFLDRSLDGVGRITAIRTIGTSQSFGWGDKLCQWQIVSTEGICGSENGTCVIQNCLSVRVHTTIQKRHSCAEVEGVPKLRGESVS